ncbi:phosphotransferase family protein [Ilumatobacter sp.]|uniref:phosphotransferase family protein n=1 Tax=Ilumatobacter sp. TaxID=1967498 RepID=UPI003C6FFC17
MDGGFEGQVARIVEGFYPRSHQVEIVDFGPIPGGFSRETFRFDAIVHAAGGQQRHQLILRKDPPPAVALLETSRAIEHDLIEAVRLNTTVPVTQSLGYEMDRSVLGEAAMVLRRADGNSMTTDLFHDGPDVDQVDDVVRHLCESLVELHQTDIATLNPNGDLDDPRHVGIDVASWDRYMDSTFDYYLDHYSQINRDPMLCLLLDVFLTLRRTKPRPLPLSVVHGDFNPANFLYADGRVTALIDWENARVGDPREDLGWMAMMDGLSNTSIMSHPADEGGFLAYYNTLTGYEITEQEIGYFVLFGSANIAVPINAAINRRVLLENRELLHLYLIQSSAPALPGMAQLLQYPGVPA